jgi:hypothetical protein
MRPTPLPVSPCLTQYRFRAFVCVSAKSTVPLPSVKRKASQDAVTVARETRASQLKNLAALSAQVTATSTHVSTRHGSAGSGHVSGHALSSAESAPAAEDDTTLQAGEWVCTLGMAHNGDLIAWLARVVDYDPESEETLLQHFQEDSPGSKFYVKNTTAAGKWSEHRSCTFYAVGHRCVNLAWPSLGFRA